MTLISPVKYIPPFEEIKKEGDLVILLKNVFEELDDLQRLPSSKLSYTLKLIDKENYDNNLMTGRGRVRYVVDLSRAKNLIDSYREKSERGCMSCVEREVIHEDCEKYSYCKLTEFKESIDSVNGCSPRIKKYKEKGCDKIETFFRPIKEVLKFIDN